MAFGQATEIASLFARIGADTSTFDRAMRGTDSKLGKVGGAMKLLGGVAAGVAVAGITALGVGIGSSLSAAKEFDAVMSGAKAVLGETDDTMARLADTALRLGKETAFSAAEAAGAIEMLAKNGLTAEQILGGAADAAVALAAATGSDLRTAADISTDAMAAFNIAAGDMSKAIDGISAVTVTSKFDINDYALALAQGGGVAASVGVSFDDFNTTISALAPLFASGSDAGTSFKVFLQRLVPQSNKAMDSMRALGLITEDGQNRFFDATGKMKSMAEIAGILQKAIGGLSDEQRTAALNTIFGTDSMRAAAGLAKIGETQFRALAASMGQVDAQAQALTRLDNLAGDLEQLSGSIETVRIKAGRAFTPLARMAVRLFTDQVNKLIDLDWNSMVQGITDMAGSIQRKFQPVIAFIGTLADSLMKGFNLGGLAGGLDVLTVVFREQFDRLYNWLNTVGIPSITKQFIEWGPGILASLGNVAMGIVNWARDTVLPALVSGVSTWAVAVTNWAGGIWNGIEGEGLGSKLATLWGKIVEWVQASPMGAILVSWQDAFIQWAFVTGMTLRQKLQGIWKTITDWVTDPSKRKELLDNLTTRWDAFKVWADTLWDKFVKPGMMAVGRQMQTWIDTHVPVLSSWQDTFAEFFRRATASVGIETPKIMDRIRTMVDNVVADFDRIVKAIASTFGLNVPGSPIAMIGDFVGRAVYFLVDIMSLAIESFVGNVRVIVEALVQVDRAIKRLAKGDTRGALDALAAIGGILEGFNKPLRDRIDSLRGQSSSTGGGSGGFGTSSSVPMTQGMSITVNVSADAIPTDRVKIQALAQMLWREAELAGMRI